MPSPLVALLAICKIRWIFAVKLEYIQSSQFSAKNFRVSTSGLGLRRYARSAQDFTLWSIILEGKMQEDFN